MTKFVFLLIFCSTQDLVLNFNQSPDGRTSGQDPDDHLQDPYHHLQDLKVTMEDMVKKATHDIARIRQIDTNSRKSVAFEIGHIYCIIFDKYRMMVSRYNQSLSMPPQDIWNMELLLNLDTVASLYFEIVHLKGMLREIERKYAFAALVGGDYDLIATTTTLSDDTETEEETEPIKPVFFQRHNRTKIPRYVINQKDRFTKNWKLHHQTRHYWPNHTYGWEPLYWDF